MLVVSPTPEELGSSYWDVYVRLSTLYLIAETSFEGGAWYEAIVHYCFSQAEYEGVVYSLDLVEIFFVTLHDYDFSLLNTLIDATTAFLAL